METSRRDLLRNGAVAGAVVWSVPAVRSVQVAQAAPSGPVVPHAISYVGIIYTSLSAEGVQQMHAMKAEFAPGATGADGVVVAGRWLVEADNPRFPFFDGYDASAYLPGDVGVIDPAGPLAGAEPPATFADELDEDGEPSRVMLGLAEGTSLVQVLLKCGTDTVVVDAADLEQTFDGVYVVESCATYLGTVTTV